MHEVLCRALPFARNEPCLSDACASLARAPYQRSGLKVFVGGSLGRGRPGGHPKAEGRPAYSTDWRAYFPATRQVRFVKNQASTISPLTHLVQNYVYDVPG